VNAEPSLGHSFKCPVCCSLEYGSSNCAGPGDLIRHCHGHIAQPDGSAVSCRFTFPQADDAKYFTEERS
jgi:hypothetical protein